MNVHKTRVEHMVDNVLYDSPLFTERDGNNSKNVMATRDAILDAIEQAGFQIVPKLHQPPRVVQQVGRGTREPKEVPLIRDYASGGMRKMKPDEARQHELMQRTTRKDRE